MKNLDIELIKRLRHDMRSIKNLVKGKYLSPYHLCIEIEDITKESLRDIKSHLLEQDES